MRALVLVMLLAAPVRAQPPTSEDAVILAGRLATALEDDVPLGDLVDPQEGLHVWQRPGVAFVDQTQFHAVDQPSKRIAASRMNAYYRENYARLVAAGLRYSLAHLDVDPRKPNAASYDLDCEGEPMLPRRATLTRFVLERRGDVKVTFVVRNDKLYVASIYLDDPCSL
jgi:hypothetical protein